MPKLTKLVFFALIVKPLVFVVLGLNIRGRNHLPPRGPAIIAANHNSHLDVLVLMSLYPLRQLPGVRPIAAADYFFKNRWLKWLARHCIDIIPIERQAPDLNRIFDTANTALDVGNILIIFPEGSRGEPEKIGRIKKGLFHLLQGRSDAPVTPVFMHGLGRALPRGTALFVPFNCDVIIGEALQTATDANAFVAQLEHCFARLAEYCITRSH
ncbi:MAG: 1-acyl-sn-glycerol-3-phosphate acyltransferase [Thiothrix sp.]|nr:1-acyl-sn-glycerol-3-phosphate acyltransferase [Thiothrix sp.]HPQ95048.1 lysophospholipid acyltransferase family protein [Thiolinea sp.]